MKNNTIKAIITGAAGFLSSILGTLYIPVLLMACSNIIDYATGLMAAPNRKGRGSDEGITSYKSMEGITKKVSMWLLVVVGAIIDELLKYSAETLGFSLPFHFLVASVVAIWIVCNEIISILENMVDIGIKLPVFLIPLVKNIKAYTESLTGTSTEEEEE